MNLKTKRKTSDTIVRLYRPDTNSQIRAVMEVLNTSPRQAGAIRRQFGAGNLPPPPRPRKAR